MTSSRPLASGFLNHLVIKAPTGGYIRLTDEEMRNSPLDLWQIGYLMKHTLRSHARAHVSKENLGLVVYDGWRDLNYCATYWFWSLNHVTLHFLDDNRNRIPFDINGLLAERYGYYGA